MTFSAELILIKCTHYQEPSRDRSCLHYDSDDICNRNSKKKPQSSQYSKDPNSQSNLKQSGMLSVSEYII